MYKQKVTKEQEERLRSCDKELLIKLLRSSDEKVVEDLRSCTNTENIRFLQGASHVLQNLLKVLG